MAATKKAIENSNRLRYTRALERFHKSIVSYLLNAQDLTSQKYIKKVQNAIKVLNRVEPVVLYKGELKDLELLVKKIISYKESSDDIEMIKNDILHSSNLLDKNKNARRYKKDKHTNKKFNEWDL